MINIHKVEQRGAISVTTQHLPVAHQAVTKTTRGTMGAIYTGLMLWNDNKAKTFFVLNIVFMLSKIYSEC